MRECEEDRFLRVKALKVSIFMSLFDVRINGAPASVKVLERNYYAGQFFVANVEKASLLNERNSMSREGIRSSGIDHEKEKATNLR